MYRCTIYSRACTLAALAAPAGPSATRRVGAVTVEAPDPRRAAARAYVRRVGRQRARFLKDHLQASPCRVRGEVDSRDIAPSLRRVRVGGKEVYQLDNLLETWFIRVRPVALPAALLSWLRSPSPN